MGNTDSIPIVSQCKSLIQVTAGDRVGAKITQENFIRGCPLVSQVTSVFQFVRGNPSGARQTQSYFVLGVACILDSIPVVGHAKGAIHYVLGDKGGAKASVMSATRTVGVIGGGVGGVILLGPAGAIAGGILGGVLTDAIYTAIESKLKGSYVLHGYFYFIQRAFKGRLDAGTAFDFFMMPVFDGLIGGAYAKVYESLRMNAITQGPLRSAAVYSAARSAVLKDEEVNGLVAKKSGGPVNGPPQEGSDGFEMVNVERM